MLRKVLIVFVGLLIIAGCLVVLAGGALLAGLIPARIQGGPMPAPEVHMLEAGSPTAEMPAATADPRIVSTAVAQPADAACTAPITLRPGADGKISYQNISFTLDPALGSLVEARECKAAAPSEQDPWAAHPAYTGFRLPARQSRTLVPRELHIYHVDGDMSQYLYPLNSIETFRAALDNNASAQDWYKAPLSVRGSSVSFSGGKGLRAVVEYAQDYFFFTNNGIQYEYNGLSADGSWFVRLQYPLQAPFLIDLSNQSDPNSNVNTQAIPVPAWNPDDMQATNQIIADYNAEALRRFAQMSDADFTPDLALLDGLVQSIEIK